MNLSGRVEPSNMYGKALSCMERMPRPADFDVVFVVGPHKSGTSLLTELLAHRFFDPSRMTNPTERGYGERVPRYLTRECSIVRWINARYRGARSQGKSMTVVHLTDHVTREAMDSFLRLWSMPIVIRRLFSHIPSMIGLKVSAVADFEHVFVSLDDRCHN